MRTALHPDILATDAGREADAILRSCVHCGFCTATCPTYQVLGDELDGPRGRIVLIKEMLERDEAGADTRLHLDRCLTCRACETTCPSGVRYGRLLDIGRAHLEEKVDRPVADGLLRRMLLTVVPRRRWFVPALRVGQSLRPLLPAALRVKVPPRQDPGPAPAAGHGHDRRVILLDGCVQGPATPRTNRAAARVLDRLGIGVETAADAGCCGALPQHLGEPEAARALARRNVDAWWPRLEAGAEALVMTASGCGVQVREYGDLLAGDPAYAERAAAVAARTRDLAEFLVDEDVESLGAPPLDDVAWHCPCTLQHGQRLAPAAERLFDRLGWRRTVVRDPHLCCGSAGTYSILQPALAEELRRRKLAALQAEGPRVIATANVGCQLHLGAAADVPVRHWIELLDDALATSRG